MKILKIVFFIFLLLLLVMYQIPATQKNFFDSYPKNDSASQKLRALQSKKLQFIEINGSKWNYYIGGTGEKTILFLHGMGGSYDLWWQQISNFEKNYKVITYTLPENIKSLKEASNGILKILEKEKVNKFIGVGTSMGGYILQYLMVNYPDRIEKVVLGNTFPPNKLIIKKNASQNRMIQILPEILVSKLGDKKLNNELVPAAKNSELLKAFLPSLPFSKKQFLNRYQIVIDYFKVNPNHAQAKKIPKLIIESDNDPLIPLELRNKIKNLYPEAQVYTFYEEGHFPYINAAHEYNEVLSDFLTDN